MNALRIVQGRIRQWREDSERKKAAKKKLEAAVFGGPILTLEPGQIFIHTSAPCECCRNQLSTRTRSIRINRQSAIPLRLCTTCELIGVHTFAQKMVDATLIVQADQRPSGLTAEIMDQGWP